MRRRSGASRWWPTVTWASVAPSSVPPPVGAKASSFSSPISESIAKRLATTRSYPLVASPWWMRSPQLVWASVDTTERQREVGADRRHVAERGLRQGQLQFVAQELHAAHEHGPVADELLQVVEVRGALEAELGAHGPVVLESLAGGGRIEAHRLSPRRASSAAEARTTVSFASRTASRASPPRCPQGRLERRERFAGATVLEQQRPRGPGRRAGRASGSRAGPRVRAPGAAAIRPRRLSPPARRRDFARRR